jgi:hypothetical protein
MDSDNYKQHANNSTKQLKSSKVPPQDYRIQKSST